MTDRKTATITFRVDASLQIGTGHVMRCLTLAEELKRQGHECLFICREHAGHLGEMITAKGFPLQLLPGDEEDSSTPAALDWNAHAPWLGTHWEADAHQTREALKHQPVDWLVVDHYALDARWEAAVLPNGAHLLVIDDLADRPHNADLLLDQNLGRQAEDYQGLVPDHCTRLIGPRYALLRPEFARLRESSLARRATPRLQQLLISMGGVDKDNATGQVLDALKQADLPSDCRISVVMGGNAPWLDQVKAQATDMPWPIEVVVNVSDMAERMAQADLAIGAAGSTSWERCCLGLPTLMVVLAENQREIAENLHLAQAACSLGNLDLSSWVEKLQAALSELVSTPDSLSALVEGSADITQGRGAEALVNAMLKVN